MKLILSLLCIIGMNQTLFASYNTSNNLISLRLELTKNSLAKIQLLPYKGSAELHSKLQEILSDELDVDLTITDIKHGRNGLRQITVQNKRNEKFVFLTKNYKILSSEALTQNLIQSARTAISKKLLIPLNNESANIQYQKIQCDNANLICKIELNVTL